MMKSLKLFLASLLAFGTLGFATAPAASAYDFFGKDCKTVADSTVCGPCKGNQDATVCQDSKSSDNPIYGKGGIIGLIVNILSIVIGVAAVIVIIIAGIQYMLSTGDPTKVNNSKNAIIYAVVGLVVAVVAQAIVRYVISRL